MVEPRIVPREEHPISRRDIDPDALKVLYRLRQGEHVAYLVGGSVRDLLLGRRPKDFDIGTSAHPYQVKKLFRNCWIIGRRFRLAHVRFGSKVIEVATFRRQVEPGEEIVAEGVPAPASHAGPHAAAVDDQGNTHLIHRDNTFGTPEEDAFRRDFTINALFYDIATFSVIDYVNGLQDLEARLIRSIGDPGVRFLEDPVRMLRAVVLAARLDFDIDEPILDAIETYRHEIGRAAPARMLEEFFKILRSGSAEKSLRMLKQTKLLRAIAPELDEAPDPVWESIARIDRYRQQFPSAPDTLTNAMLAGTLLVPLGLAGRRQRFAADPLERRVELGMLQMPRRDVERLHQVLAIQSRLLDLNAPVRAQRALLHRHVLNEALVWLEIHGGRPEAVHHWRALQTDAVGGAPRDEESATLSPPRRRRRRRRGRRSPPAVPRE